VVGNVLNRTLVALRKKDNLCTLSSFLKQRRESPFAKGIIVKKLKEFVFEPVKKKSIQPK
jgi:hypothetical protein